MAWTAPKTYAVGDVLTAADMNTYQRDNFLALGKPSWAYAKWTIAMINDLNYRTYSGTRLAGDQEGGYTIVDAGSQITVPETATYEVSCSLWTPNNAAGSGAILVSNNAGTFLAGARGTWAAGVDALGAVPVLTATEVVDLSASDFFRLGGYCNSNATRWDIAVRRLSPG